MVMPVVVDRLLLLEDYLSVLHSLERRVGGVDDLARDPVLRGAVERYLHLVVEGLIDIGFRVCSLLGFEKPTRYRDVACILERAGFLDRGEAELLELWIGFRNILVHAYARIDVSKVFDALKSIGELERIVSRIKQSIGEKRLDPVGVEDSGDLASVVRGVVERYSCVVFAYVFGSFAEGRARSGSDVDVAVYVEGVFGWRDHVRLMHDLEDAVGRRVDLVVLNEAPPLLAYEVVSKGRLVYCRDDEVRARVEAKILREYFDVRARLEAYFR